MYNIRHKIILYFSAQIILFSTKLKFTAKWGSSIKRGGRDRYGYLGNNN